MPDEFVFAADGEGAGEGAVVELGGFVHPGVLWVSDLPEFFGAAAGVVAGNVAPGVQQGYLLVRDDVAYGSTEEGKMGLFLVHGYRLFRPG